MKRLPKMPGESRRFVRNNSDGTRTIVILPPGNDRAWNGGAPTSGK